MVHSLCQDMPQWSGCGILYAGRKSWNCTTWNRGSSSKDIATSRWKNVTLKMRCDCMARQSTALGRAALEIKSGLLTLRTGALLKWHNLTRMTKATVLWCFLLETLNSKFKVYFFGCSAVAIRLWFRGWSKIYTLSSSWIHVPISYPHLL